jgi:LAO/AO transport system kinase
MTLATSVLEGDRLALARLLTEVENDTEDGRAALRRLFSRTGRAHLVGITGALAVHYRSQGTRVAIAAVDPSSPFTGGAVLGDRVRMQDMGGDADIFFRSMASRGALGGLARTTAGIVQVFDAAGFETILVETVGAGQGEVDIARLAHTVLVVEAPGLGDEIQAIKAGILEIADILVINKADRPGAEQTEKALRSVLELATPTQTEAMHHGRRTEADAPLKVEGGGGWRTPIQKTIATGGHGIEQLAQQIANHYQYLRSSGLWEKRDQARLASEIEGLLQRATMRAFRDSLPQGRYNEVMQQVLQRKLSPGEAVLELMGGGQNPKLDDGSTP